MLRRKNYWDVINKTFFNNLLRFTPLQNGCLIKKKMLKPPLEVFCKKLVQKNFAKFTEKQLCWSFLSILNIATFLRAPILKNNFERLLLKMGL